MHVIDHLHDDVARQIGESRTQSLGDLIDGPAFVLALHGEMVRLDQPSNKTTSATLGVISSNPAGHRVRYPR